MSKCVECGSTENVIDHHISYEDDLTVPMCRSCHLEVHDDETHKWHPLDDNPTKNGTRPNITGPVEDKLKEIQDENDYPNFTETIRNVLREAGYDNV